MEDPLKHLFTPEFIYALNTILVGISAISALVLKTYAVDFDILTEFGTRGF